MHDIKNVAGQKCCRGGNSHVIKCRALFNYIGLIFFFNFLFLLMTGERAFAQLQILNTNPTQAEVAANTTDPIRINFNRKVDLLTANSSTIKVRGEYHGGYQFFPQFEDSLQQLRLFLTPSPIDGERITMIITTGLNASDGSVLNSPYQLNYRYLNSQGNLLESPISINDIPLLTPDVQPVKIGLGDFNNDQYIDAAVINSGSNTITIIKNVTPQINFPALQAVSSFPLNANTPVDITAADFDNDGNLDIVTANFNSGNISILWGMGAGVFKAAQLLNVGLQPSGVIGEDLIDGDGWLDIAVSLFGENKAVIFRNEGGRIFSAFAELACETGPFGLAAADVDADGDADLAVINNGARSVSFFRNQNFAGWQPIVVQSLNLKPVALKWGNVLRQVPGNFADTFPELIVLGSELTIIGKFQGGSGGGSEFTFFEYDAVNDAIIAGQNISYFGTALSFDLANIDPDRAAPADLDADLLISDFTSGVIDLLENQDNNGWATDFQLLGNTNFPRSIVSADLDRDGDQDILFTNHQNQKLGFIVNGPVDLDPSGIDSLINFGNVYVGDTVHTTLSYRSNTGLELQVEAGVGDEGHFDVQPRNFTVPPNNAVTVNFSFFPSDTLFYFTPAAFQSDHPLQQDPLKVVLIGKGIKTEIRVVPDSLDFGTVPPGASRTLSIKINNDGNAPLQISEMLSNTAEFTHQGGPDSVQAYRFKTIDVTFSPLQEGLYSDTLFIKSNDRDKPEVSVLLRGNSRFLPDLTVGNLQASLTRIYENQTTTVTAKIENLAADAPETFLIKMTANGAPVFDTTVTGLVSGGSINIRKNIRFARKGEIPVTVAVDPENTVAEVSEVNNQQTIVISVRPGKLIVRPNPFTPNNDNMNDRAIFDLTELGLISPRLNIFDFLGRKIRLISGVQNNRLEWDGTDIQGNEQLPGVYLYVLQDGSKKVAKGHVVLAR